jgi:hypothetical protein
VRDGVRPCMSLKGLLALAAAFLFLGVSLVLFLTRRSMASKPQTVGLSCFGIMALTHVFEAFAIFPSLGWGKPRSIGHYADLIAALSGVALLVASFAFRQRDSRSKKGGRA